MADSPFLPIKVIIPTRTDFKAPDSGGGPRKVFDEPFTKERRTHLVGQLNAVRTYFGKSLEDHPDTPCVAHIQLKTDAIAKSHRRNSLFSADCPVIGSGRLGELLISVTGSSLERLASDFETTKVKDNEAFMSAIEHIRPHTIDDTIGQDGIDALEARTAANGRRLKLRLFIHGDENRDAAIHSTLHSIIKQLDLSTPRQLNYARTLSIYEVGDLYPGAAGRLADFVGSQRLSAFPTLHKVEALGAEREYINTDEFPNPDPTREYALLGIIDSGVNPEDPLLNLWVEERHVYVPEDLRDHTHGSIVASLAVHGKKLNGDDPRFPELPSKLLDVMAIPDLSRDYFSEDNLIAILREVLPKHHKKTRIWNLSIETEDRCTDYEFSDLAVALDELQQEYGVIFVIAAGNYNGEPKRGWPPEYLSNRDRICAPADSVRGLTVGAIAHSETANSLVRGGEPSPFTRRGPGPACLPKPDIAHFGGNLDVTGKYQGIGLIGTDGNGHLIENIGTSYATPLVSSLLANVDASLEPRASLNLSKALLIHAARLNIPRLDPDLLKYQGFGVPPDINRILVCEPWLATLIFELVLPPGLNFVKQEFPVPDCLRNDYGKMMGDFLMTLVYDPPMDANYNSEYCRTNVDVSLGTYVRDGSGKWQHRKQVLPEPKDMVERFERHLITHGFKWSPVKMYSRSIPRGIEGDQWRLCIDVLHRAGFVPTEPQSIALVVSIIDPSHTKPVYNHVVQAINRGGWISQDLQLRERWRLTL